MYLVTTFSPAGDEFVSLGKTKKEAIENLAKAYEDFYDYDKETLKYERGYTDFEKYIDDFLGMGVYKISLGETVITGCDVHYMKGERK